MSIFVADPRLPFHLLSILKAAGLIIASPFLLAIMLAALVAVLVDFAWFRLRATFTGELHPKGLWEF
jgi:hypothetical protein